MAKVKHNKSKKKKLLVFGGLGLLLLIVVLVVIFSGDKEKIVSIQTEKVSKRTITQTVTANGTINPVEKVELRPEVTGEIVELPVKEGDKVKRGQLLIRLKPDQYIARLNRAEASLISAQASLREREATLVEVEASFKRVKELYEKELASESDLESANSAFIRTKSQIEAQKANVLQARENYNDAKVELEKTSMFSPLDGTISQLNVEKSERVLGSSFSQGTNLMTVADLNQMEAVVEVVENDIVLVSVGDTSEIVIDAYGDDQKFKGYVTQIGNSALTSGIGSQNEVVNFEVKIRLIDLDKKIRPGMSCDAEIRTETKRDVLSVPIQSVTARVPKKDIANGDEEEANENGKSKREKVKPIEVVFIEEGNLAKKIEVDTGISDDTYIEIKSGLEDGQMVISGPYKAISKELSDSTKVKITNDRSKRKDK